MHGQIVRNFLDYGGKALLFLLAITILHLLLRFGLFESSIKDLSLLILLFLRGQYLTLRDAKLSSDLCELVFRKLLSQTLLEFGHDVLGQELVP